MPRVELDIRAQVAQLSKGLKATQAQLTQLQKKSDQTNKRMQSGFDKSSASLQKFAGMFGIAFGGAVFLNQIKKTIKILADFQTEMAKLSSLTGLVGKDLDFMKEKAIELSKASTKSAKEIVEAFSLVGSAKPELLKSGKALAEVTKQALILAEAAGITVPAAADALTKSLNQFGEGAEKAAMFTDILATSQQKGTARVGYLSEAMKKAGSIARTLSISFETTNAIIQGFAKGGIEASEAGTAFASIMSRLAAQGNKDFNPTMTETVKVLNNMKDANISLNEANKLVGINMGKYLLTLMGQIDVINELNGQLYEQGNAAEQAAVNTNTLAVAWDDLAKSFENYILLQDSEQAKGALKDLLVGTTHLVNELAKGKAGGWFDALKTSFRNVVMPMGNVFTQIENIRQAIHDAVDGNELGELSEMFGQFNKTIELVWQDWRKLGETEEAERITIKGLKANLKELIDTQQEMDVEDTKGLETINKKIIALKEEIKAYQELGKRLPLPKGEAEEQVKILDWMYGEWDSQAAELEEELKKIQKEGQEDFLEDSERRMEQTRKEHEYKLETEIKAARKAQDEKTAIIEGGVAIASTILGGFYDADQRRMQKELTLAGDNEKKKEEIHKKYAKKRQLISIAEALISGAGAIIKNTQLYGFAIGSIINIAQLILTATQVAVIASQKFAKGGYDVLSGKRHHQGGVQIPIGEAEEGEGHAVFSRKATRKFKNVLPELVKSINQGAFPVIDLGTTERLGKKEDVMRHMVSLDESKQLEAIRQLLAKDKPNIYYENGYRIEESKGLIRRIKLK